MRKYFKSWREIRANVDTFELSAQDWQLIGLATIAALVILREKLLRPILASVHKPRNSHQPKDCTAIDQHYENLRQDMFTLMHDLRIAA